MIHPSFSFKKNLRLVACAVLTLLSSFQAYAMEAGNSTIEKSKESAVLALLTLEYIDQLIHQAKQGDIQAQDELMDIYTGGGHWEYLQPERIDFLCWQDIQERCYGDDRYAFFILADECRKPIVEHFPDLLNRLKERTNQGHVAAQYNLAFMYNNQGLPFPFCLNLYTANMGEILHLYTLAANQGYPPAQHQCGYISEYGLGGQAKDKQKAICFYQLAAKQGYVPAQYKLATLYACGRGVQKNEKEAFLLFKLAANKGHRFSQQSLGYLYEYGDGVDKNLLEACYWYLKVKCTEEIQPYIISVLPYAPIVATDFQGLHSIQSEINYVFDESLKQILINYQKVILNKIDRGHKSAFSIPALGNMYEKLEAFDADIMAVQNILNLFSSIKPGFMVTAIALAQELQEWLPKQITPFVSVDEIDGISYVTLGEKNVKIVREFVRFLNKFKEAEQILSNIACLYEKGLGPVLDQLKEWQAKGPSYNNDELKPHKESVPTVIKTRFRGNLIVLKEIAPQNVKTEESESQDLEAIGKLMVWQRVAKICDNQDVINFGEDRLMHVNDYFDALKCLCPNSLFYEGQEEKFNNLILYLKLPLQEIEDERIILNKLQEQIKSLPRHGVGRRNKDFWESEEYSFLKEES
ncbi:MAG: SEL1-like repeat protein [Alphaproteobacteria bacterium]|nr:SEL1-like repeat protein [Alphaproteobacteria bacterium]